jgi:RNA polymerase sigma-70 factor (ECF subfamily)
MISAKHIKNIFGRTTLISAFALCILPLNIFGMNQQPLTNTCNRSFKDTIDVPLQSFVEFNKFYDLLHSQVFKMIISTVRNFHDAQEISQNAFLKIYVNWNTFNGTTDGERKSWIYTIAKNEMIQYMRNGKYAESISSLSIQPGGSELLKPELLKPELLKALSITVNPESIYAIEELNNQLNEALLEIPEEFRKVLVLRYINGHSTEETAQILGIKNTQTIKNDALRGLNKLSKAFKALTKQKRRM